jgi:hypothetical protein
MTDLTKKLADSLRKSLKAPPFDEDIFVKDWVSRAYWRDGRELYDRARLTSEWASESRSKAFKQFIDLVMSVECSLKSIILSCSPSSEAPESAYKVARKKSHGLEGLANESISREPSLSAKIDLKLLSEADEIGVQGRYSLEMRRLLASESLEERFFSEGAYSRVLNNKWLTKFAREVRSVGALAHKVNAEKFPAASHRAGAEIEQADKRLKKFIAAAFSAK